MVNSTATTKRSVTARACQAGDVLADVGLPDHRPGTKRAGPRRGDDHPAQLPDGSAGMFVELPAPLPVLDDRRVGVVPPAGRVRAADRRRPRCSGVVRPAGVVHSRSRVVVLKPWRLPLGVRKTPRPQCPHWSFHYALAPPLRVPQAPRHLCHRRIASARYTSRRGTPGQAVSQVAGQSQSGGDSRHLDDEQHARVVVRVRRLRSVAPHDFDADGERGVGAVVRRVFCSLVSQLFDAVISAPTA